MTDLPAARSLRALARALDEGTVSAVEHCEAALGASRHGAYRTTNATQSLEMARLADAAFGAGIRTGPLQGVPVSVKDLYGVPTWPTYAGSPNRLPPAFERAGPVVERLLVQLGVVTGKTHTVEFAFGGIGTNPHTGTPRNPFDPTVHRAPGGSSAGAGVALQEGSCALSLGTDTAGSVRIPASWTGTVGLKTTAGRWSTAGIVPLSSTLDTAGLLARTVDDLAFGFAAFDPRGPDEPGVADLASLTICRAPDALWEGASPGVVEAVDQALGELPGTVSAAVPLPVVEALELFSIGGPVAAELDSFLEQALPDWRTTLDPNVAARVKSGGDISAREYLRRRHAMAKLAETARAVFADVDVVVSPTVANTPPPLAELADPDAYRTANVLALRNTSVANYLGLCALTVPCGLDAAGMPVGLQLIGPPFAELSLLAAGAAIERALGTSEQRLGRPPHGPAAS